MKRIRFELDNDISGLHIHEELEILFVLSGRAAVMTNSQNFVLEPEGVAVFNCFQHHEIYLPAGSHVLSCYVSSEVILQAKMGYVWCCSTLQPELKEYFHLLREKIAVIFKECQNDRGAHELFIVGNLYELLDILKSYFERPASAGAGTVKMQDILLYIGKHYSEKLTLNHVASQFFVSPSFLSRQFQREMRTTFSDYLRKIRVQRAAYLLEYTQQPVTEIALSSGFSNTNALIESFKRIYKKTPGEFRRTCVHEELLYQGQMKTQVSYMSLFRYMNQSLNSPHHVHSIDGMRSISIDAEGRSHPLDLNHKNRVSVGRAKSLLLEVVQKAVKRVRRELGIQYIYLHAILDDVFDVYHQNEDGEYYLNFFYLDLIFDFLVSVPMIPVVELSFTPKALVHSEVKDIHVYSESLLNLPDDIERWGDLVRGIVQHFKNRYGIAEVSKWIFSCRPALFASYKVFSFEEYARHYVYTVRVINDMLPKARVSGFGLDIGFIMCRGDQSLQYLLKYCKEHDCLPDELSFQCFHCDYSSMNLEETEKRINVKRHAQNTEPAEISMDTNYLSHGISYVREILERFGCGEIPISISAWNSSIWQCELGNDTCYKAAFIVKNILENEGGVYALSYAELTDYTELVLINANTFHGGHGLITYDGLPKAGYYAYELLNQMEGEKISSGDGYCVTRSQDGGQFQIMLYHYCHYNADTRLRKQLSKEEERTYDRYYSFCDKGMLVFQLLIENMKEGQYELIKRNINRMINS